MAKFPGRWEQQVLFSEQSRTEPKPTWYDTVAEQFREWRALNTRPAWRPIVRLGDVEPGESRFGGPALLRPGEAWPVCECCGFPLSPLAQLNLATLPDESPLKGQGVFQLFYCRGDLPDRFDGDYNHCEAETEEAWASFGRGKLLRIVTEDFDQLVPSQIGDDARTFDCRAITGWEQFSDFPEASEHESCGVTYDYKFEPGWTSVQVRQLEAGIETSTVRMRNGQQWDVYDAVGQAVGGDKLGGWPRWVQHADYPDCQVCGSRMNYVLQIDSAHNVPFLFGDVGTSHILQCEEHTEILTLNWQCG